MSRLRQLSVAALLLAVVVLAATLAACGGSNNQSPGAATPPSSSPAASPSPSTTPQAPAASAHSPSPTSVGAAVPAGFRATSVTFVSTEESFVLGTAPGCGAVVVQSRDRGATWTRLAAPSVDIGWPQSQSGTASGVWGIRFASASHGFVFGRGLWETTDGGAHWQRAAAPPGSLLSLAAIDGQVLALVEPGPSSRSATLLRRPLAGGSWTKVATADVTTVVDPTDLISTQAGTAALLVPRGVLVTRDGGLSIHTYPAPGTARLTPAAVGVTAARSLALLAAGGAAAGSVQKRVYVSPNGGALWTRAGAPSRGGDPVTIAGGSPATLLVAAVSGGSEIYRSTDGGHTWTTALNLLDGGVTWADLGFTTPTDAVVIHGPVDTPDNTYGRPGQLLLSSNGGGTWRDVSF